MKLSIIIPVYNDEQYLRQCLEAAIAQTINEKEIICVNDGSSDQSEEILKEYVQKYDYIRYYNQQNQGAGMARNLGLEKATGEYVVFLDADDFYMDATALEKMYFACQKNKVKICGSFRSKFYMNKVMPMDLHREVCTGEEGILLSYKEYQEDYHYHNYIYEKALLVDNNIYFPSYRRYQDPPFFVRAMITAEEFFVVPVELYCYREDEKSLGRKKTYIADAMRGMLDVLESAIQNDLPNLHNLIVERINGEFDTAILENALKKDEEVLGLLRKANEIVRWDWYTKDAYLLKISSDLTRYEKGMTRLFQNLQDRKVVIFGCGNRGTELQELFAENEITVQAFCDNSLKKQGNYVNGVIISSLKEVMSSIENPYFVIASAVYAQEIKKQLLEANITENNIFIYKHYDYL